MTFWNKVGATAPDLFSPKTGTRATGTLELLLAATAAVGNCELPVSTLGVNGLGATSAAFSLAGGFVALLEGGFGWAGFSKEKACEGAKDPADDVGNPEAPASATGFALRA